MRNEKPAIARTSLADALFTTTQQRVIGLLFGQAERSFYASEIITRAGIGSGAVQRELKRLETSGLVSTRYIGNRKHYQANRDAPVFEELRSIAVKTFGLGDLIREALQPLEDKIAWAVMFGSVAKGTDTAASDIDLMIVGDRLTLEEVFKQLDSVELQLGRKISPMIYSRIEFSRRLKSGQGFIARVLDGEYISLMGDKDVAATTG